MEEQKWFKLKASKREFCVTKEDEGAVKIRFRFDREEKTFDPKDLESVSDWARAAKEEAVKEAEPVEVNPGWPYGYVVWEAVDGNTYYAKLVEIEKAPARAFLMPFIKDLPDLSQNP